MKQKKKSADVVQEHVIDTDATAQQAAAILEQEPVESAVVISEDEER